MRKVICICGVVWIGAVTLALVMAVLGEALVGGGSLSSAIGCENKLCNTVLSHSELVYFVSPLFALPGFLMYSWGRSGARHGKPHTFHRE